MPVGFIGPDGVGQINPARSYCGPEKDTDRFDIHILGSTMRSGIHRHDICSEIAYIPQGLEAKSRMLLFQSMKMVDFFRNALFWIYAKLRERSVLRALPEGQKLAPCQPAGRPSFPGGMKQKKLGAIALAP